MNYVVATYLVRFAGFIFIIPAIFPGWFMSRFPGLEAPSVRGIFFVIGIAIYIVASIAYYILRKKELARRRIEMEELEKKI